MDTELPSFTAASVGVGIKGSLGDLSRLRSCDGDSVTDTWGKCVNRAMVGGVLRSPVRDED